MALLRKLDKFVGGKVLTGSNRLRLNIDWPVKLSSSVDSSVEHVYALPALLWHLQQLKSQRSARTESWLHKQIDHDINFLSEQLDFQVHHATRYVSGGGNLTGQAIADLYSVQKHIRASDEWMKKFVEPYVSAKLPYMSVQNLYNILRSLKGSESPLVDSIIGELGKRGTKNDELVEADPISNTIYFFKERTPQENPLLKGCTENHSRARIWFNTLSAYYLDWLKEVLFSQRSWVNMRLNQPKEVTKEDVRRLLGEFSGHKSAQKLLEKL